MNLYEQSTLFFHLNYEYFYNGLQVIMLLILIVIGFKPKQKKI